MEKLIVSLERDGILCPVGSIRGESPSDACFAYTGEYRDRPDAAPISLSLPLQEEAFTPTQTKNFFEGLLPEGFTRRTVAQWMHVAEEDYLSILHGLGRECLGALCITAEGEESEASYEPITAQQVRQLAAEGATKSAELVTKAHLSLTGASGKAGLYYDAEHGEWYLPRGSAPSTHIVKQSHVRLDAIVTNEQLALQTAARCGIETAKSFIINTGAGEDRDVLLATERYDRRFVPEGLRIGTLPRPQRLHQEDFAQALGIPAAEKYEREGQHHLRDMFALLRRASSDPIADQMKLWDLLVFDWLIGNTDAHVKNFSLLYSPNQKSIRLAPAYDIVSTSIYEQSTREMAFRIGGASLLEKIDREAFRLAAREAGLGERMALRRFDALCEDFEKALRSAAEELTTQGFARATELAERILMTGGVRGVRK